MGPLAKRPLVIRLTFERQLDSILCVGAHPDDVEIGATGLLGRLASRYPEARFTIAIFTGDLERQHESEQSAKALFGSRATIHQGSFRDGFLPFEDPSGAKDFLREVTNGLSADLVIAPREHDRHQDHAFVSRLVDQLQRDHLVVEYEIAKYDGDLGRPQVFLPLTDDEVAAKVDHLLTHFGSQRSKRWYTEDALRALLRLRGIESNSPSGYAEAFHVSKLWVG